MNTKRTRTVSQTTATLCLAAIFAASQAAQADKIRKRTKSFQTHAIDPTKELIITDLKVIESAQANYPGELSFGYLIEQAFGKEKAATVIRDWLMSWETPYMVAGRPVDARPKVRELVIEPWQQRDGYQQGCGKNWVPNLANAPFNLLAVVNRMDMGVNPATLPALNLDRKPFPSRNRQSIEPEFILPMNAASSSRGFPRPSLPFGSSTPYYGATPGLDSQAGEGRFVFGLTDGSGNPLKEGFTLILEYGLPAESRREKLYQWASDWHALGEHEEFDNIYLDALIEVTKKFTTRKPVVKGMLNGSAVSQLIRIRTNDGVFGATREFREFRLTPSNKLTPAALAGTMADEFFVRRSKANRALSRWLGDQQYTILNQNDQNRTNPVARTSGALTNVTLPNRLRVGNETVTVATGAAKVIGNDKNHHFVGRKISEELRRNFSMQTCTGCHCGETGTAYFHIAPRKQGEPTLLSEFLNIKGKAIRHRAPSGRSRHQYSEVSDRVLTLEAYLNPALKTKQFEQIRAARQGRAH